MSGDLEYEIERYLATCLASDDPDAGYMAGNVIEMCREAIASEIEAAKPVNITDPMPGCPGCGPYSDHCCGRFAEATLGPDDFLILMPRSPLSAPDVDRLNASLPARLRGRVLVVEDVDAFIGRPLADTRDQQQAPS